MIQDNNLIEDQNNELFKTTQTFIEFAQLHTKGKTIHILTHQNINLFVSLRIFLLLIKIFN